MTMHPRRRNGQTKISEADLQNAVIELAMVRGWKVCHFRPAQNSSGRWATPIQGHPGFPDMVLARKGVVMFVELKSDAGKLTRDQQEWLEALGNPTYSSWRYTGSLDTKSMVWRPADWTSGRISKVLM